MAQPSSRPDKTTPGTIAAVILVIAATCAVLTLSNLPRKPTRLVQRNAPGVEITLAVPPSARQLATYRLGVVVRDNGSPMRGARVTMTLSMPSMSMPPVKLACSEESPGYYSGAGTFTMPGEWRIDTEIRDPNGGVTESARLVQVK